MGAHRVCDGFVLICVTFLTGLPSSTEDGHRVYSGYFSAHPHYVWEIQRSEVVDYCRAVLCDVCVCLGESDVVGPFGMARGIS
jgi:hypothetical protein